MHRTEISTLGEFGLIEKLTANFPKGRDTVKGVGDDCAVIQCGGSNMLISTDFLLEGIHFDLSYTPLKHLGYKAVVANVSDIYAMNATPKHITMSLAVSNRFSVEALVEIYEGIRLACDYYGIDLIGGDTTSSTAGLVLSATVIGESTSEKIVYRHGAKVGDIVCVTGDLGAAYLGLQILIREKQVYIEDPKMSPELNDENAYLIQRILKPEARKDIIDFLDHEGIIPNAMQDISDGLSSELFHICTQSQVGVRIEEAHIPIDERSYHQAMKFGLDTTTVALSGGEDYELLFTIDPTHKDLVATHPDIHIIGEIMDQSYGYKLHTRSDNLYNLKAQGWVSF